MTRRLLLFTFLLLGTAHTWAQSLTIIESAGWLESAYVKWNPVAGATSYNVYYSGNGITDKKIDTQLIRSYGTYYRADVLGMATGTYTIKIAPVISGVEGNATSTGDLTVLAHDRSGFAFAGGRIPGAYKMDGTPKDGAVILYITENTKNKISISITGANANPCVGLETIMEAYGKGKDTRPLIVRLIGNITDLTAMADGDVLIEDNQNPSCYITAEGVGDDAVCNGWSFRVKGATNVEIRNLAAMNCNSTAGDDFGLQQDNDHVWVHNCDMFYGDAGSDADQVKGDGALDCKGSTYCTFSYNHFHDNGKSSLLGLSEDSITGLYVTYHHNWFDHCDSRHPRVRFYSVHFYNNYLDGISKYGAGSTMGSSLFVEGNYFRNCKHPMMTSMQGTDVWNESTQKNDPTNMGTFSGEDGGTIKAFNNTFDASIGTNNMRFVAYGDPNPAFNIAGVISSTTDFDAYLAKTRDEQVPATVKSFKGANVYNNFDTDASLYVKNLVIDDPAVAMVKDTTYAGRIKGGDLKWKFNNAVDDAAYLVNTALKSALTNYKPTLVSVQGDSAAATIPKDTTSTTPGDAIHNFTLSGTTSTFFTITGNLSTSKGTVTYAGLTLTQCLKIESSTNISFTTTQSSTLTLVFNGTFTGKININGASYSATAGIVTITLSAGSNVITKVDAANLYYMSVIYNSTSVPTITAIAPAARCDAGTVTLGATASAGIINWYSTATGGTSLGTGVSFTTPIISANTSYFVDATANSLTTGTRTEIAATLYTTPNITTIAPATRSDAGNLTLGATASAGTINWYAASTGGTSLGIGENFTTPVINATTSYFVDATVNNCTTASRTEIVATIKTTSTDILMPNTGTKIFNLSPNPVTESLTISSETRVERVEIYSLTGVLVKSSGTNITTMDLSNLSQGCYLVRVFTARGTFNQTIVKK